MTNFINAPRKKFQLIFERGEIENNLIGVTTVAEISIYFVP